MVLEKIKHLETIVSGVQLEEIGVEAGIDDSSLPFIFDLVSNRLYSDPIGSVVRELTSNALDSHIEAGTQDLPVIIKYEYDKDEGHFIEFKDSGVGMSPDRVYNVYMKYFTSTKRDSNEQIGGFGIGSKTPLAYEGNGGMFYIITIHDGKKYEYIFHKGESKPKLESMNGEEIINGKKVPVGLETDEPNGTTIRMEIKGYDIDKFKKALKFQLSYFDSVYFQNWGLSNDYTIYEGKHYKFRSDIKDSYDTQIHIALGKVRYPIDTSKVSLYTNQSYAPIAVKFEIGELKVTPSRESIQYDDKTIELIKERVNLAVSELISKFESQNPVIESLYDYTHLSNTSKSIVFDEEKGHSIALWTNSKLDKHFKFGPIAGLPIKKVPENFFFMWEKVGYVDSDGKRQDYTFPHSIDNSFIVSGHYTILEREDRNSTYTNIYLHKQGDYGLLIRRKELDYKLVAEKIGFKTKADIVNKVTSYDSDIVKVRKGLGIGKLDSDVNKAKTIYQFVKTMDKLVYENGSKYSDYRPTDEWIREYKLSLKLESVAYRRRIAKKVNIKNIVTGGYEEVSLDDFAFSTGIIIWGYKEDAEILTKIAKTVLAYIPKFKKLNSARKLEPIFRVIQISKDLTTKIRPDILKNPNAKTIYYDRFFRTKFFKEMCIKFLNGLAFSSIYINDRTDKDRYVSGIADKYKLLIKNKPSVDYYDFQLQEYIPDTVSSPFKDSIKKLEDEYRAINLPMLNALMLREDEDKKEYIKYLLYKGFRVRPDYKLQNKSIEEQLQITANWHHLIKEKQRLETWKRQQKTLLPMILETTSPLLLRQY